MMLGICAIVIYGLLIIISRMWNILFWIIGVLQTFFKQKIKWFYIILIENKVEKRNGRFVCQKCDRDYKRKQTLQYHLKNECGVAPQFNCPTCSYSSKRRSNLKKHVERIHNSASSSKENDTGLDDEMKDAAAGEGDSDSNCSDGTHGNNQN